MKQRFKGLLALILALVMVAAFALTGAAEETKKEYCYEEDSYSERTQLVSGTTVVYPGDEIHTAYHSGGTHFAIADKKENGKPISVDLGEDSDNTPVYDAEGNKLESVYAASPYGGYYTVPALETGYKGYVTWLGRFDNYFLDGYDPEYEDTIKEHYKLHYLYLEPIPVVYTVSFNANGGAGTVENMTLSYGEEKALTENPLTKDGYTFAGWNTKQDGTGTAYADKATVKNLTASETEPFVLFAQWTQIVNSDTESENLSSATNNGTPSDSDIVDSDVSDSSDSDVTDPENSDVTTDDVTDNVTDLSSEASTNTVSDETSDSSANAIGSGSGQGGAGTGEGEDDSSVLWIILVVAALIAAAVVGAYVYFKKKKKPETKE